MDIAQPAGADAVKLVVMIVQAAQTVRHNKKTCQQLVNRAQMIGGLLEKLQGSEKMRQPEIRSPLKVLEGVLGEAHALVKSCQSSSYVYQFLMGRKQADQFLVVQNKIDSYLLLFPLISHIETAAQLDQILNAVRPQAAEVMPKLLSGCSNYGATRCSSGDARIEVCGISGRVHAINEPFAVKESQQAGSSNVVESLSTKQSRMRRHCCGQHKESPTIHRLTGDEGSFKFTFFQLVDATKKFCPANQIGKGTFGCVYKGRLRDGLEVAIKRRSEVPPSPSQLDFHNLEFSNEVCFLTELQHTNIVKLLGCCIHGAERVLVYEYMANGSFDTFIFGARTKRAYLD
ncbi:serine/threonine-protein kinase-like protein ACR4 [Triticum dicoccoides]|uniref:serine/threonine-protein kinase-like protein ACR4 n=1 Tax=Triticum dicoccoides TaxID=85692 RepID=UPI001891DBA8|nr:serine/threonine-protein kinase-like protein ACR4 [Triticum dicoccoides]